MHNQELREGFQEAKKITQKFARTFYLASLFLPQDKKYASYAIYAICRISDETVDSSIDTNQKENLCKLEQDIANAYTEKQVTTPLLKAFRQTVKDYNIPKEYFDTLIQGMRMDLEIKRYPNFPALQGYCYKVAGVVGLIILKIFGYNDSAAENYAIKLGIAMQLTNILRDIKEDLARGRIYLPQDEIAHFHISEPQLLQAKNNEEFKNLLRFQITRCRQIYKESLQGIRFINNAISRFVVLVMGNIYSEILDKIEKNNYDVFTKRVHVSKIKKAKTIVKLLYKREYL